MPVPFARVATIIFFSTLVVACSVAPVTSEVPASRPALATPGPASPSIAEPSGTPLPIAPSIATTATAIPGIEHADGRTDVVLRFDRGPDLGASELTGEFFQPGPEFTLYGDGTVIFRNDRSELPPVDSPILRARPFTVAHFEESQVQSLLQFAIDDGGLRKARAHYETQDIDASGSVIFTIRAGDLDKRVEVAGPSPLEPLIERLGDFAPDSGIATKVWEGDRFWGSLLDVAPYLVSGVLPHPDDAGTLPWPWAGIDPGDFIGRDEGGYIGIPRRILSAREAAVLGLSDHGGLVQRVYLVGPDRETVYSFSLWPMSPDERS